MPLGKLSTNNIIDLKPKKEQFKSNCSLFFDKFYKDEDAADAAVFPFWQRLPFRAENIHLLPY